MAVKANNSGKEQIFPYSLKTVGLAEQGAFGYGSALDRIGLEIINPINLYSVEDLAIHLSFLHDGTQAGRNIKQIIVQDDPISPTYTRSISVNVAPVSLLVNLSKDIASIRNPSGRNIVFIVFDGAVSGTINSMKIDMLYTVLGIR